MCEIMNRRNYLLWGLLLSNFILFTVGGFNPKKWSSGQVSLCLQNRKQTKTSKIYDISKQRNRIKKVQKKDTKINFVNIC